jgi:hypothetical protein
MAFDGTSPPVVTDIHWADMYFDWSWNGRGFGQLSFTKDEAGNLLCMNECMSRESVRKILHAMADYIADNATLEDQ